MGSFHEELQALLDRHPEVEEVRVKYKKAGTVFKPKAITSVSPTVDTAVAHFVGLPSSSAEIQLAAEMIKKGEL
jgi:hypothetical protein